MKHEKTCMSCGDMPALEDGKVCHTCHSGPATMEFKSEGTKESGLKTFWKGITTTNPVFVLLLGLCPTLAVSTSLDNAFGMSAAVMFVLLGSNLIVSLIRKSVPDIVRIPTFIVIIASFVTIIHLSMQAFVPPLSRSLGIYVPLIVVNCIILGRAEAFASKNSTRSSMADAFGIGIGFAAAIVVISFIRQVLGTGKLELFGMMQTEIPGLVEHPMAIFILPMGAFLVLGVLLAFFRYIGVMECE